MTEGTAEPYDTQIAEALFACIQFLEKERASTKAAFTNHAGPWKDGIGDQCGLEEMARVTEVLGKLYAALATLPSPD